MNLQTPCIQKRSKPICDCSSAQMVNSSIIARLQVKIHSEVQEGIPCHPVFIIGKECHACPRGFLQCASLSALDLSADRG